MASSGLQIFPEFLVVSVVDGLQLFYCDSINLTSRFKQDWVRPMNEDEPQHLEGHTQGCRNFYYEQRGLLEDFRQHFNQTEGVHVLQFFYGPELDDETGETHGYYQFCYDGEELIRLDLKKQRWLFSEQASTYKHKWDPDKTRLHFGTGLVENDLTYWLKKYLTYGRSCLLRKVRPSVSLLQTSPSSPVSCHATGFYPDRATMFWSKDGEELHEDVDHGEILPNQDGTFQMTVDLDISSVKPEDWTRYDCVFQLSGLEDIVTKLDKAVIRTNSVRPSVFPAGSVLGVVVGLMLLLVCITGLFIWRKKKKNNNNGSLRYPTAAVVLSCLCLSSAAVLLLDTVVLRQSPCLLFLLQPTAALR
ncbi:hypothetical protein Q5P01_018713 [Channa striata]|uniref:Ig-like domain-containing protein n=1 Tax=Channa striata TaxID=64152 RepID=A0AA88SA60_CHASR|nr:hypothetical protein Q5P01_018713 [Channa striata]